MGMVDIGERAQKVERLIKSYDKESRDHLTFFFLRFS